MAVSSADVRATVEQASARPEARGFMSADHMKA